MVTTRVGRAARLVSCDVALSQACPLLQAAARERRQEDSKHFAALAAALPAYPLTMAAEKLLQFGRQKEWAKRRRDRRASEMALYFVRPLDQA